MVMAGPILWPTRPAPASAECAGPPESGPATAPAFGSWRSGVSGKESGHKPLSRSLKNLAPWIPVLALAASLGYSASIIRRRVAQTAGAPPPARESPPVTPDRIAPVAESPEPESPPEVPAAPKLPEAPVAAPARARATDLSVYSNFNFVARRMPGIPRVTLLDPSDTLKFPGGDRRPAAFSHASFSFRLMFPVTGPEASSATPGHYSGKELAMAVYAETGGLFPTRIARGSVYDPAYWESGFNPGGTGDLMLARRMVAETRKLNKRTHLKAFPADLHRLHLLSWYPCAEAAEDTVGAELYPLPPGMRLHFFIRQDGVGRSKPAYLRSVEPVLSFGPFVNVGGGDVPRGEKTYIDFYVLPAR